MLIVLWEYDARPGLDDAFEQLYGAQGEWAALFREHDGFVSTELLRADRPHRYLSIDRWESESAYQAFLAAASARYAQIDARGDALTTDERRIGRYVTC
ncbi:MAG TPA: antibiotic biosynthesis monooxygenase family protein [Xanthomonadaceae bacterium]|nr:antibiotic biosynthesis monooxygenase family protein [Xanthomonadaceae bacterium]